MTCPRCQADKLAGMRFCGSCGAPLLLSCPGCAADNSIENKFCGQCGGPLAQPAVGSLISFPGSDGELKRVTVLFCDLVDSTGLAERNGPEMTRELIRGFMDIALAEVHRYGGTAPQFTGDGFMALFGAPIAHEDHVRRALLAALAVRDAIDAAQRRNPELQIRSGIHTGLVVFGSIADNLRMHPTAIGDAANVAARLQGVAAPGTILLSDETYNIARGYARVEPLGPLLLKGKSEPIATYRLLGIWQHRSALDDASLSARPFVDRKAELGVLLDLVRLVTSGHGRALGIVGEAGIGKSRLVAEFRSHVAGIMSWVDGRCLSYATSSPYLLVLDLLRGICGMVESDTPDATAAKLEATLQAVGMNPEADGVLLSHLLGIRELGDASASSNAEGVKSRAFETLRQLCIASSRGRPLVLALEDLHWVDQVSEEFLRFLADAISGTRILLLATYRPGYRLPWIDKSYASQLSPHPLSRADSLAVIRSVLARLDEPLTEAILAKADGNPLFLEQLAFDAGEARRGRRTHAIPNTIHDVMAARIDRLPEETKRLLQTAAVIGREFSLRVLGAVWQGTGPIDAHLRELTELEFINEQQEREGTSFVFRHSLTQEMAYTSLLERHRRALHTRIGRELEGFYQGRTEEVADWLALHFSRSDETDKAIDYAILAAEKAQRRWANSEALAYFEDALRRLTAMPDTEVNRLRRLDAVLKQADVRYDLAQYSEYLRVLEESRGLIEGVNDPRRQAVWHYWSGLLHSLAGNRPEIAVEHCEEALKIASAHGLEDVGAFSASCLAQVFVVAGRPRDAIVIGERALGYFETQHDNWWAARTLWFLAIAANYLGNWTASIEYCQRGLDHGLALNDPRFRSVQPVGWWRMGWTLIHQGDLERGLQCCDQALAVAPILPRDAAMAKAVRGYGHIKAGRLKAGIAEMSEAVTWLKRSGFRFTYMTFALQLAEGYLRHADAPRARVIIEEILEMSRLSGYPHVEARACWLMGDLLGDESPDVAENYVEAAMRLLDRIGARNDLGKAMVSRAGLRQRAGDIAAARQLLEDAHALFRALETLDEPARVEAALAALDRGSPIPWLQGAS